MKTSTTHSRRTVLTLTGAGILGSLAGCLGRGFASGNETTEQSERFTFDAATVEALQIQNVVGDVTVAAVDTDDVVVEVQKLSRRGERGLDAIEIRTSLTDGVLDVETSFGDSGWIETDIPVAHVTVELPRGEAGPAVRSVYSDLGDVSLLETRGDTIARTDLGDVTASNVDGYLTLESELGGIEAAGVTGLDRVFTELGDVKVDLLGVRGDVDVGTDLGSVTVGVADDLPLDVLAESRGSVSSNLTLSGMESSERRVSGLLNGGGPRLSVTSDLGDVALRTIRRADRE